MRFSMIGKIIAVNLKVTFSITAMLYYFRTNDRRFWTHLGIGALVVASISPIFYLYLRMMQHTYEFMAPIGQGEVILTSAFLISTLLVFLFGIGYVFSVFYFSRDLDFLLPLPLTAAEIIGGKFSTILITEYLTIAPFFLPAIFVYGIHSGVGFWFWPASLIVYLMLPVIPLALCSLAILILMSVTNLSQKKDLLRILGMFGFIVIILVFNLLLSQIPAGEEEDFMIRVMEDSRGMVQFAGRAYPPSIWATEIMVPQSFFRGLGSFLGLSLASVIGLFAMMVGADRFFYRGLIGGQELQKKQYLQNDELRQRFSRKGSPVMAIAWREIKILFRTPIYMFNTIALLAVAPVAIFISMISGGAGVDMEGIIGELDPIYTVLGGAGFMALMAIFVPGLSSSISREGRLFTQSKLIPLTPEQQIYGKLISGYMLTALVIPLLLLIALFIVPWTMGQFLIIVLLGLMLSLPVLALSLLIDLIRPYLTWENPQQAIKQNMNVLFAAILNTGIMALLGFLMYRMLESGLGAFWIYVYTGLLSLILGVLSLLALLNWGARFYDRHQM